MLTTSARPSARVALLILAACSFGCGDRSGLLVDDIGGSSGAPSATTTSTASAPPTPPVPSADAGVAPSVPVGAPVDPRVAASLDGLRWELPCTSVRDATVCATPSTRAVSATMGGEPGTTYEVSLRFRGVVELSTYEGGTNDGAFWQTGGTPPEASIINVYALTVSSPARTYYLNRGISQRVVVGLDYPETIVIAGGATVTLFADSRDALELRNVDMTSMPIVVPGIAPAPAAFAGQFVQMDVTSVHAP